MSEPYLVYDRDNNDMELCSTKEEAYEMMRQRIVFNAASYVAENLEIPSPTFTENDIGTPPVTKMDKYKMLRARQERYHRQGESLQMTITNEDIASFLQKQES